MIANFFQRRQNIELNPASRLRRDLFIRFKRHKLGYICAYVLVFLVVIALLAPIIAPYDPDRIVGPFNGAPQEGHILGLDQSGRDVFSRLLYGLGTSLKVSAAITVFSVTIGVILGLLAGYFTTWVDTIIMRIADIVMSFPYLLLVLVASAVFKPGFWSIVLILAFVNWPGVARLVRGNVLSLRVTAFVENARIAGFSRARILFREILPNTIAPLLIYASNVMAFSMLDEAALSFLGQGIQQPEASLGNMLNAAQSANILQRHPWLWVPQGLLIIIVVVSINFVGDALRDALDPTSQN